MAVHPIEERYGTPEMRAVWSEKTRFACVVAVEVALAKAEAAQGMIPAAAAAEIGQNAQKASLERAKAIEHEISHDMMAMVTAISEVCGDSGRWVHYGATSNDILDTATGLQLLQALRLIEKKLRLLLEVLIKRSEETKSLVCIGRTHGQHGVPTTYGLRFAIWASEVGRHIERLEQLRPRVVVGQMTGAVGTQAALGPQAMEVQATMMEVLGIGSVDVSNQVISRDRYAEYFMFCANVATTLDKIAIEIRSLQRTEIGEVEEAFGANQVGSSTMPHKRNPIRSEQVCGLARIVPVSGRAGTPEQHALGRTGLNQLFLRTGVIPRGINPHGSLYPADDNRARRTRDQPCGNPTESCLPPRHQYGRVRHDRTHQKGYEPPGCSRADPDGKHAGTC